MENATPPPDPQPKPIVNLSHGISIEGGDFVVHGDQILGDKVSVGQAFVGKSSTEFSYESPAPGVSPFKGLTYFDVADAPLFFGREALTTELVALLQTKHFLAVIGASGSGKSSVVRAGLVPALQSGKPLAGGAPPPSESAHWPVHIITPTAHPLESLAASLTRHSESVTATSTLIDDLRWHAHSLHLYVRRLLAEGAHPSTPGDRLLLLVDQFEELFTLCHDKAERQAFIDNLLTAAGEEGVTTVVITLRADFYAHCAEFDNLRTALTNYQVYIGSMNYNELRRAIEEPARVGGWVFEPGLVDLILQDVGDKSSVLPLLSHALLETWQRREGHTLTLAGYIAAGRVQSAIAKTAEMVYMSYLTTSQQVIAKNIFLRLIQLGESPEDTGRRVALDELFLDATKVSTVESVLYLLGEARLITTDADSVQVSHEALIRAWPRLREWREDERYGWHIHRRLTQAAQKWEALERDPWMLYSRVHLEETQQWADSHHTELNELERSFLKASQDAVEAAEREKEGAKRKFYTLLLSHMYQQIEQELIHNTRLRILLVILTILFLILLIVMGIAAYQR